LSQNYPNPFNPTSAIGFSLPRRSHIELSVYNILGQRVTQLVNGTLPAGEHVTEWDGNAADGRPAASGVYLYRLKTREFTETKKMLLLR
jgi:flagellar hook assembly protein FlgD